MSDPPDAPSPASPARRFGAPRDAVLPRMENVRVTAPDLKRRAALDRMRGRLLFSAAGFAVLFLALVVKLADATIIEPRLPKLPEKIVRAPDPPPPGTDPSREPLLHARRAMITDRNGEMLAISLPTSSVYANPREMIDPAEAAHKLKTVLPQLDEATAVQRLSSETKQFVYLARQITPPRSLRINALGIPGHRFRNHRAPPLPARPRRRPGAGRGRCGRPRRRRGGALLRSAPGGRVRAAAAVARCARAGGGARRAVQGDGRVQRHRRLRHRDGRAHRRSAGA